MKKYILGFILGAVLFSSGIVFAKAIVESKWYVVDKLDGGFGISYQKTFDEDTNVVCYEVYNIGISCLKNN